MGAVGSLPAIVGGLATRMLYYLLGANYNQRSIAVSDKDLLTRWRGRDYHVYDRMGYVYLIPTRSFIFSGKKGGEKLQIFFRTLNPCGFCYFRNVIFKDSKTTKN